ncbi:CoA transferase [Streptomyces sp. NPDC005811]|uniref:CoA transferase n=1 Tax=Streptomyces sp. NPDC005811 TaxID=3154565 RepID=UPI0033E11AEE
MTGHSDGSPLLPPGGAATLASRLADHIAAAGGTRLDGALLLAERAALSGRGRQGRLSVGGSCRLMPTRNGWAAVSDARPDDSLLWSALIGRDLDAEALPGRLADWLTAHDGAELDERVELLGLAGGSVRPQPDRTCPVPGRPRDVAGSLVVDFSALWAGPLCAYLLGTAGARVVKVETPSRPDGARFGAPVFYDLLHAGHASVVLDPMEARGRAALHELVGRADVVIEASRPRALAGFGLDAEAEAARGCTWISITAYGRASGRIGFGDDVAASRGLLAVDGDGLPVFAGDAVADPLTGLLAAGLALSEQPGGGGALLEVSMADVVSASLSVSAPGDVRIVGQRGGWLVDTGGTSYPMAAPRPRRPTASAAASGADTAAVLCDLGIRVP